MFVLAATPEYFPRIDGFPKMRHCRTEAFPPYIGAFSIYFEYDADTVTLLHIDHTDAGDG
jgi:hypothetical protein